MPVIARFYGILIKMYFREHGVPHRAQRLIRERAEQYKGELERMWETQDYKKLPGLE